MRERKEVREGICIRTILKSLSVSRSSNNFGNTGLGPDHCKVLSHFRKRLSGHHRILDLEERFQFFKILALAGRIWHWPRSCVTLTGAWFLGVVTLHPVSHGLAGTALEMGAVEGSEACKNSPEKLVHPQVGKR